MKKLFFLIVFSFLAIAGNVLAESPWVVRQIIYFQPGDIQITNPERSQSFYDDLKGSSRNYFIHSDKNFELHIEIMVPAPANMGGRYSVAIFSLQGMQEEKIVELYAGSAEWKKFYNPYDREYFLKGPEISQNLPAGDYRIEVFSSQPDGENQGKYVLSLGRKELRSAAQFLNISWQLPFLKISFLKTSVWQFFLTPFGVAGIVMTGVLLVFLALIFYFIGFIRETRKHHLAKTLLLTSSVIEMKDEITKLLQKPAYDITVAFIPTAAKPREDLDYVKRDWDFFRETMGFNVEEIDIEGKKESELIKLLNIKDIIFVEGGNTFYLLKAMRKCNFGAVIKKILKSGKVYIGCSAGSIVAGRSIKTAGWFGDQNIAGLKNLKGLKLVPFDIFVHYQPEYAEIIKKKMPWRWQRRKLKILTDHQAILVQGKKTYLIGKGEAVAI